MEAAAWAAFYVSFGSTAARWTMRGNIERRSVSLLELLRRARLADQARRGEDLETADEERPAPGRDIVSPRDERGTPYPGDFPNDLARYYRGCF
jgi:hypothetical protein